MGPGVVSMVEAMTVLKKERHLLVVIDDGVTSLEVGVNDVALEGHIVDSLRQRVLAAVVQWT